MFSKGIIFQEIQSPVSTVTTQKTRISLKETAIGEEGKQPKNYWHILIAKGAASVTLTDHSHMYVYVYSDILIVYIEFQVLRLTKDTVKVKFNG